MGSRRHTGRVIPRRQVNDRTSFAVRDLIRLAGSDRRREGEDRKGKQKEEIREDDGGEWRLLEEWVLSLADLVPLPDEVSALTIRSYPKSDGGN